MKETDTTVKQDLVTGLISSLADVLTTHPLWTIKTLQQQGFGKSEILNAFSRKPSIMYTGVISNAATMIPLTTTRIFLSSLFHKSLAENQLSDSKVALLGSSFAAGCVSSLFGTPTELIRTIQLKEATLTKQAKRSFFEVASTFTTKKNLLHLGNGGFAIMMRDGSYTAAFFTGAPLLKEALSPYIANETLNTILAYSIASIAASLSNHPFDTIKTRQHLAIALNQLTHSHDKTNFISVCQDIVSKNGFKGFWRGYAPRGVRFLLGLAIKASCIESLNNYWVKQNTMQVAGAKI